MTASFPSLQGEGFLQWQGLSPCREGKECSFIGDNSVTDKINSKSLVSLFKASHRRYPVFKEEIKEKWYIFLLFHDVLSIY